MIRCTEGGLCDVRTGLLLKLKCNDSYHDLHENPIKGVQNRGEEWHPKTQTVEINPRTKE